MSDTGQILFTSPVVGKVTSSTKRLEPITTVASGDYAQVPVYNGYEVGEIMQTDGTYGSSDSYVFWFDPEGNYYQWSGSYILSSVPLKLKTPVFSVRDIDTETKEKARKASEQLRKGKKITNDLEVIE